MLLTATANMGPMQRAGEPLSFGYGLNVDDPTIHEQLGLDMLSDMPAGPDLLNQNQNGLLSSFFQNFGGANTGALSFGEGVFTDYDLSAALFVNDHTSLDMFGAHWNPSVETRPQHANSDAHIYPSMSQPTRDDIEAARALTLPRAPEGASHDGMQFSPTHQVPVHLHHDPSFMFNPTPASAFPRGSRPSPPAPGLQFGTDSNFSGNTHYAPPAVKDQSERLAREQMETLGCLDRVESAASTRATSPVQWAPEGAGARGLGTTMSPLKLQTANIPPAIISEELEGPSPRSAKRRKSCKSAQPDEEDERPPLSSIVAPSTGLPSPANSNQPSLTSFSKRRKQQHNSDEPAGSGGKRKRQSISTPKPPRENLTADQKRSNHIMSEQKRRNIIKTGFDQLNLVVPALKGGGFSKANVLKQAALWLEEIEQGNKLLQRLLDGEADE